VSLKGWSINARHISTGHCFIVFSGEERRCAAVAALDDYSGCAM
jgi:hypothetical protein